MVREEQEDKSIMAASMSSSFNLRPFFGGYPFQGKFRSIS